MAFLLAIAVLVVIHELGHYLVGRRFGVRAEAFSVGFGRELAGWTDRRGTRWKLGWLPLGGYVRFAGDMNPASVNGSGTGEPGTFQAARLWQRALIVLAGPAVNFLFAVLLFLGLFAVLGEPRTAPVLTGVEAGGVADAAGFRPGDRVLSIDGDEIDSFEELSMAVRLRPGRALDVTVLRDGRVVELSPRLQSVRTADRFGNQGTIGRLGVAGDRPEVVRHPAWRLPGAATRFTVRMLGAQVEGMGQLIRGERSLDELGGPVKIAKLTGEQASLGAPALVFFLAALSLNLAFINLLPIPMLDGGHLLFYAVEAVRGRPADPEWMEWAFRGGLALVLTFFLFVTVNDVSSLFG